MTVPRPAARARRSGRRPGGEDTRGRILLAAREAFGERGFEAASVRDIAARAGVDAALVHHYFGTKQRLFVTASQFPVDIQALVPAVLGGPPEGMGVRFVRFVVDLWDRPEVKPLLLGVVRSATTDPVAATMLRGMLTDGPLTALAAAIDRPDARARAGLAGSQLVGLVMARYILRLEPIASMPAESIAEAVGPTIERYLRGDVDLPGPAGGG